MKKIKLSLALMLALTILFAPTYFVRAQISNLESDQASAILRILRLLDQLRSIFSSQNDVAATPSITPPPADSNLGLNLGDFSQYSFQVLNPMVGESWSIGKPHSIVLNTPISISFPVDSQLQIRLVDWNQISGLARGGIIGCVKQANRQSIFDWDGQTLMGFCGTGDAGLKYRAIYPGRYKLRFVRDNPTQTVITESAWFNLVGNVYVPDANKPPQN